MTPGQSPTRHDYHWPRLVHRRLLLRLTAPALIGLVLLALAVADLVRARAPAAILLWIVPGVAAGYVFGRLTRVAWDSEASQVVQDGGGVVLLLAYVGVRLGEGYVLSPRFFDWPYISNAAALLGVGLLLGRALGTRKAIVRALESHDEAG